MSRNSLIDLTEDTAKRFFEEGVTKLFHAEHDKHIMEQARGSMDRQSHSKITAGSISGEVHISKEAMAENKGVNDEINPMHWQAIVSDGSRNTYVEVEVEVEVELHCLKIINLLLL